MASVKMNIQIPYFAEFFKQGYVDFPVPQCGSPVSNESERDSCDSLSTQGSFESYKPVAGRKGKEGVKKCNKMKQKTELCKTFSLGLVCPYGNACSFAHGRSELRSKVLVPTRYKTTKCRDFHKVGYCKFGSRCQFIHKENNASQPASLKRMPYTKVMEALELSAPTESSSNATELLEMNLNLPAYNLPRLSVFESLAMGRGF